MSDAKTNLTLKQRQRMAGKAPSGQKAARGEESQKELSRVAAVLLLLLAFGVGTALGMVYFRPDPRLEEIDDIQTVVAEAEVPDEIRGELMGRAFELSNQLPSNLREQVGMGQNRWSERLTKFFAKSSADQLAEVQQDVAREKAWEAEQAAAEQAAAANPAADASQTANKNSNTGRGGWRNASDQQRAQRMQQRLSNSTPQQRSQGTMYRQMRNALR